MNTSRRLALVVALFALAASASAATKNFYAAKTTQGTGDCLTKANACTVDIALAAVAVWANTDDRILWLTTSAGTGWDVDATGHYTGNNSMLTLPATLNGTALHPVIISVEVVPAINSTRVSPVLFDAENVSNRYAVQVSGNDYITLRGFSACCTNGRYTMSIGASSDPILGLVVEDVVAWDASPDLNMMVWGFSSNGTNALNFRGDRIAGFGKGRKIWQWYNITTGQAYVNVGLFRWEYSRVGCVADSPKMPWSGWYNSEDQSLNNVFFLWSAELVPATYNEVDGATGVPCATVRTNHDVACCVYGLPAADFGTTGDRSKDLGIYGSMSLMLDDPNYDEHSLPRLAWYKNATDITIQDFVGYIAPLAAFSAKKVLTLSACDTGAVAALCGAATNTGTRLTSIGGGTDSIATSGTGAGKWNITDLKRCSTSTSAGMAACGINIYGGGANQANLQYQYINGVLQDGLSGRPGPTTLWDKIPSGRWAAEMAAAGHVSEDISARVISIFGAIPANAGGPQPTPTPSNTPTDTPTSTPTGASTATNTPTASRTPTITGTRTVTPTATAVAGRWYTIVDCASPPNAIGVMFLPVTTSSPIIQAPCTQ